MKLLLTILLFLSLSLAHAEPGVLTSEMKGQIFDFTYSRFSQKHPGFQKPSHKPNIHFVNGLAEKMNIPRMIGAFCNLTEIVNKINCSAGDIYIDAELDPEQNALAVSAIGHEMIHYFQWLLQPKVEPSCAVIRAREVEAYTIQAEMLLSVDEESSYYANIQAMQYRMMQCNTKPSDIPLL